jgi:hypothetical protein
MKDILKNPVNVATALRPGRAIIHAGKNNS